MEKVYKPSIIAFIWNLIVMSLGLFVSYSIFGTLLNIKLSLITVLIAEAILIIWAILRHTKTKIILKDDELSIYYEKKIYKYNLKNVKISSKRVNNDTFYLYVNDNDIEDFFDLSILGLINFEELLDDLGVVGRKSKITKLNDGI